MPIKVKDVMISRVVSCPPTTTVVDAAKEMKREDVGSIVIIKGKNPIGIVTREDIVNKIVAMGKDPSKTTVKQIMTTPVITASPEEDIQDVAVRMNKYGYERLPVKYLDKLVGLISVRQILKIAPGLLDVMKERLEEAPSFEYEEEFNAGECELCGNFDEKLRNVNDRWVCASCEEEAKEI